MGGFYLERLCQVLKLITGKAWDKQVCSRGWQDGSAGKTVWHQT